MQINVTARHCEIPDELKRHAEDAVRRVTRSAHRPQRGEIIFNVDHGKKVAELQLALPRGQIKIATAEADDFKTALDRAVAKLKSQLDKDSGRPRRVPSSS